MGAGYLCNVRLSHMDDWGHEVLIIALQLIYSVYAESGSHRELTELLLSLFTVKRAETCMCLSWSIWCISTYV